MKPIIIANWKMNPQTLAEAKHLFNSVKKGLQPARRPPTSGPLKNVKNAEIVICPPYPYLPILLLNNGDPISIIRFGAQDVFWEEKGAFTGEISPKMLKDLGCQYVILGHSERRRYLGETDEMVNKKLKATIIAGLRPILCIGSEERNQKKEFREIENQLKKVFSGIKKSEIKNLVITYEPVWAISTTKGGRIPTPKESREGANFIRKILIKLFDKNFAKRPRIIYGGSVDSKNVRRFIYEARMDGVLVGAASLKTKEFIAIIKAID